MKRCVANKIGTSEHVPVPDYHLRGTHIVTPKQICSDFPCLIEGASSY